MMSEEELHLESLLRRVRQGDQQAAQELVVRFGTHVLRVARARVPGMQTMGNGRIDSDCAVRLANWLVVVAHKKASPPITTPMLGSQDANMSGRG